MIKFTRAIKKIFLTAVTLLLVLVIIFFMIQKNSKNLNRDRVALVDVIGNSYIFRGNNPFVTKNGKRVFAYDELKSQFNEILQQQGYDAVQNYHLIDISLLDLDEYYTLQEEKSFFSKNPEYGGVMINISTLSPSLLFEGFAESNFVTKHITTDYSQWVTNTLEEIHEMASRQTDKPVIIYIHCDGGRDRTGLIVAGYRMLFNNMNYAQVKLKNVNEVGRNSEALYDQAIHSYCLHIKRSYRKADDYCI